MKSQTFQADRNHRQNPQKQKYKSETNIKNNMSSLESRLKAKRKHTEPPKTAGNSKQNNKIVGKLQIQIRKPKTQEINILKH